MPFSAWSSPFRQLIVGDASGASIWILGQEALPACMAARYKAAILFRPPGANDPVSTEPWWFLAQIANPGGAFQVVDEGWLKWTDTACGFLVVRQRIGQMTGATTVEVIEYFGEVDEVGLTFNGMPTLELQGTQFNIDAASRVSLAFADTAVSEVDGAYTSTSTSFVTTSEPSACQVSSICPPSGKMVFHFSGRLSNNTAGQQSLLGLELRRTSDNALMVSPEDRRALTVGATTSFNCAQTVTLTTLNSSIVIGTEYTARLFHRVTGGTGSYAYRRLTVVPVYV